MKKLLIMFGALLAMVAGGADLYLTPEFSAGPDTFVAQGKKYRIWGIRPRGDEERKSIATRSLDRMLGRREYKFIVRKESPDVVRFAVFGRNGKDQENVAVRMLKRGLVQHNPNDLPKDEKLHKPYCEAEKQAKKARIGVWAR